MKKVLYIIGTIVGAIVLANFLGHKTKKNRQPLSPTNTYNREKSH